MSSGVENLIPERTAKKGQKPTIAYLMNNWRCETITSEELESQQSCEPKDGNLNSSLEVSSIRLDSDLNYTNVPSPKGVAGGSPGRLPLQSNYNEHKTGEKTPAVEGSTGATSPVISNYQKDGCLE